MLNKMDNSIEDLAPPSFLCPITQEIMTDPMMLVESGQTYERSVIEGWLFNQNKNTDPLSNQELKQKPVLVPNRALKNSIQEYLDIQKEKVKVENLPKEIKSSNVNSSSQSNQAPKKNPPVSNLPFEEEKYVPISNNNLKQSKSQEEWKFEQLQTFINSRQNSNQFRCPITNQIFREPVLVAYGLHIERSVARYVLSNKTDKKVYISINGNQTIPANEVINNYTADFDFLDKLEAFLNENPFLEHQRFDENSKEGRIYKTTKIDKHAAECDAMWLSDLKKRKKPLISFAKPETVIPKRPIINNQKPIIINNAKSNEISEDILSKRKRTSKIINNSVSIRYDYRLKFKLLGDSGVGKSSLLLRFTDDEYTESFISTIGVDYKTKNLAIYGNICLLQIWDTAGQERFRTIKSQCDKNFHATLICFDITNPESFNNIPRWLELAEQESYDGLKIVVGTKSDLQTERKVSYEDAIEFCDSHNLSYFETSARENFQIEELFQTLSVSILEKIGALDLTSVKGDIGILPNERLINLIKGSETELVKDLDAHLIIQQQVKNYFGELDNFGFIVGGHYQTETNEDIKNLIKQLLKEAKNLTSENLDSFISLISRMGASAKNRQMNLHRCPFDEDVKLVINQYNSLKNKQAEINELREEINNNLQPKEEKSCIIS